VPIQQVNDVSTVIGLLARKPEFASTFRSACRRGNDIGATTYGSIASILKNGLDRAYAKHAGEAANDAAFRRSAQRCGASAQLGDGN
jgi:hypothetical protein